MKPRRLESDTIVSRSATAGATSLGSAAGVVTTGAPLIRDRGRATRDSRCPDATRPLDKSVSWYRFGRPTDIGHPTEQCNSGREVRRPRTMGYELEGRLL